MQPKSWTIVLTTLTILVCGCSDSPVTNVTRPITEPVTLSATPTEKTPMAENAPPMAPLETPEAILPPQDLIAAFEHEQLQAHNVGGGQLSNVVLPVISRQESDGETTLQLLGFVGAKGLETLLSEDGKLHVVGLGESADGPHVLAVEAPQVTVQDGETTFDLSIFQQEGFHEPAEVFTKSRGTLAGETITPGVGGGFPGGMPGFNGGGFPGIGGDQTGPGGMPGFDASGLPGLPRFDPDEGEGTSGLVGVPGLPKNGKGVPALPGLEDGSNLPGLPDGENLEQVPGLPGGDAPSLPGLPGGNGTEEGLHALPGFENLPDVPADATDDVTLNN